MADFIISFLAGGISGTIAKTCTAPIERVKFLLQTQDTNPRIINGEVVRYDGIIDCFKRISREQGITAFWRGNSTNIIRYFPLQGFNFALKDSVRAILPKVNKHLDFKKFFAINVLSGGIAGAGSLILVYPIDFARTRIASEIGAGKRRFHGLRDCIVKTVKVGGLRSLYNGMGLAIIGIIPYRGFYFGLFDTLSSINAYQRSTDRVTRATSTFICAQISAVGAAYISYPFDTIRRRLQLQSEQPKEKRMYTGVIHCFSRILREEDPSSFFRGAGANALRTVGAALVLVIYSELSLAFR